jgi:hypothetical protein
MRLRLALLTLCLTGAIHAQVAGIAVTTQPPSPNVNTPVTIVVTSQCACPSHITPITRNGSTFDIPYNPLCLSPCIGMDIATYDVGVLGPGVYTVRHFPYDDPSAPEVIGSFAVVGPAVPALDPRAMIALAIALTAMGLFALRR